MHATRSVSAGASAQGGSSHCAQRASGSAESPTLHSFGDGAATPGQDVGQVGHVVKAPLGGDLRPRPGLRARPWAATQSQSGRARRAAEQSPADRMGEPHGGDGKSTASTGPNPRLPSSRWGSEWSARLPRLPRPKAALWTAVATTPLSIVAPAQSGPDGHRDRTPWRPRRAERELMDRPAGPSNAPGLCGRRRCRNPRRRPDPPAADRRRLRRRPHPRSPCRSWLRRHPGPRCRRLGLR